jgi:hypothetical protein
MGLSSNTMAHAKARTQQDVETCPYQITAMKVWYKYPLVSLIYIVGRRMQACLWLPATNPRGMRVPRPTVAHI